MTYNSSIRWQSGMRITADTFRLLEADLSFRQQIAIQAAVGAGRMGLLPDAPFHAEGVFVRRDYEMTGLQCTAVLPSGRLLHADGDLTLPIHINNHDDADYYITVEFGVGTRVFERDGVPYETPEIVLNLHPAEEMETADCMPIKRLYVTDGVLNVDDDYIPPVLISATDNRIATYLTGYADALTALAQHPNMDKGDCQCTLQRYAFLLNTFDPQRRTHELIAQLQEIQQALDYYIVKQLGSTISSLPTEITAITSDERRTPKLYNLAAYLKWMREYMEALPRIMEKVVIEKPIIDIEAIKKDVHDTLYPELKTELTDSLIEKLRSQLMEELPSPIIEEIKRYIEETIRPQLCTEVHDTLRTPLYDDLYAALKNLIDGLLSNMELREKDTFTPLI